MKRKKTVALKKKETLVKKEKVLFKQAAAKSLNSETQNAKTSKPIETKQRFCPFLSKAVVFALFCVALLAAYLFYDNFLQTADAGESAGASEAVLSSPPQQAESVCVAGQQKNCSTSSNCSGVSVCASGEWSACIVKKTCVPGSIKVCPIQGGCGYGRQTCNECGTGYAECK